MNCASSSTTLKNFVRKSGPLSFVSKNFDRGCGTFTHLASDDIDFHLRGITIVRLEPFRFLLSFLVWLHESSSALSP